MSLSAERVLPLLTAALALGLTIVVAHSAARLVWHLVPPPPPSMAGTTTGPATTPDAIDYAVVSTWSLFGIQAQGPAPAPAVTSAPETPLNLKLSGVFYTRGEGRPLALIAVGSAPERRFGLDDAVAPGVTLVAIEARRVILEREGRLETLSLPVESLAAGTTPPPRGTRDRASLAPSRPEPPAQRVDASDLARQLRQALSQSPDALRDLAVINPHRRNGKFVGFQLRSGRNRRLLRRLQLRPGDIITEVNGRPLTDPTQGNILLQTLLTGIELDLKVLRGSQERAFSFFLGS
ncbi:MAG: type II secretion system protein GspC [Candidatus Competibacterales bacterium]